MNVLPRNTFVCLLGGKAGGIDLVTKKRFQCRLNASGMASVPGSKFIRMWAESARNDQCSIFCMVIVVVGELPAVRLYETQ